MFLDKIINNCRIRRIVNQFRALGINYHIDGTVKFLNPKYMCIGNDFYLKDGCVIEAWDKYNDILYKPELIIGNNVRINSFCHIGVINHVEIGDGCLFGSRVTVIDHSHGRNTFDELLFCPSSRDLYSKGQIKIGKNVWIGENAVVLPGVVIGDGAVIGANAVVTHDIPAYSVAAGVPAKVIKTIE